MKKILSISIVVCVVALAVFALIPQYPNAPKFQLTDLKGQVITEQHLQGKVTLINFWFPSCRGCVSEMPKLIQMAHDYQGKDFQILAIAVPFDPLSSVQQYVQERQLPFTVMFDSDKTVTKSFVRTEVFPTSVLINKRGEILKTFVAEPNFPELYQEVNQELEKYI